MDLDPTWRPLIDLDVRLMWWRSEKLVDLHVLFLILLEVIFLNNGFWGSVLINSRHRGSCNRNFNVACLYHKRWLLSIVVNVHLHTRWLNCAHDPLGFLLLVCNIQLAIADSLTGPVTLNDWQRRSLFSLIAWLVNLVDLFLAWLLLGCQRTLVALPHLLIHVDEYIAGVPVLCALHVRAMFSPLIKLARVWLRFVNCLCLNGRINKFDCLRLNFLVDSQFVSSFQHQLKFIFLKLQLFNLALLVAAWQHQVCNLCLLVVNGVLKFFDLDLFLVKFSHKSLPFLFKLNVPLLLS